MVNMMHHSNKVLSTIPYGDAPLPTSYYYFSTLGTIMDNMVDIEIRCYCGEPSLGLTRSHLDKFSNM